MRSSLPDGPGPPDARFTASGAYERFMGRWSRQLAARFVAFAGVADGDAVLDVGCGTGALAFAAAAIGPGVRVEGVDRSAAYVRAAEQAAGGRARFRVGDALHLDAPAAAFDRTLSLLALNFVPDRERAVAEMCRVTRPGGVVAAAVWDYGDGMTMLRRFWDAAAAIDPGARDLDEAAMPLCRSGELTAAWRGAGLDAVDEQALVIEMRFAGFDDYWAPFLEGDGPAGRQAAGMSPTARRALAEALFRALLGDGPDRGFTLPARAWAVRGVVPR
ncbi:MAG: class I SAM-dependent methyltransferase [Vicinamibacterales bacterium]